MATNRMLSLPVITAIHRILCGYYDGSRSLGMAISTHANLDDFFGECGIEVVDAASINKKIRATIEWLNSTPAEHNSLKRLLEQIADPRYYGPEAHGPALELLNGVLRADGFELRRVGGVHRLIATGSNAGAVEALITRVNLLDLVSVRADFDRAIEQIEHDPADAVTAACSIVESVCKCILDEMQQPYPAKEDIKGLVKEVSRHLNLSPDRADLPAEWEPDIRQILGGLVSVVGGVGALRTHAGDAHGKGKKCIPVDARIARLAIHAASTVSLFFIETWQRMTRKARQRQTAAPGQ